MAVIIPQGEEVVEQPITWRPTKQLLKRIEAAAKATGNNRSDVISHLVRWALDEFEHQQAEERQKAGVK